MAQPVYTFRSIHNQACWSYSRAMTTLSAPTNAATNVPLLPPTQMLPLVPEWREQVRELAACFDERAAHYDETDSFVAENYADLKAARMFSFGVPASLGGGNGSYSDLCEIVRTLARSCGSTGLALSMHFHLVAALVWRWRNLNAPVQGLLERIAHEQIVLVSSGSSDWLQSSGTAEAVEGGFRINARKIFSSGCPAGDLLMTSAVFDDPQAGPTVLHFPIAMNSPQVTIVSTRRTHGMRGTGSNDLVIENAFVPAASVSVRRPKGRWHPAMHLVSKTALPIIYSAYTGIAEAAREIALKEADHKRSQADALLLAGELENHLLSTHLAYDRMVEIGESWQPNQETTNAVLMARTLAGQSAIRTVEKAIELVGGRSFYRSLQLERLYRDVQAARFHPLPEKPQQQLAGRIALGVDLDCV